MPLSPFAPFVRLAAAASSASSWTCVDQQHIDGLQRCRLPRTRPPACLQVCRLAMLTLLAVFRDIIPAYRIRPMQEEEEGADKASSKAAQQHAA